MYQPKKIIVVTGHFGSGKTNFSVALALELAAKGEKVTVVGVTKENALIVMRS